MNKRDKYRVVELRSLKHNYYSSLKKATAILSLMSVPAYVCRISDNKIVTRNYYITRTAGIPMVIYPPNK